MLLVVLRETKDRDDAFTTGRFDVSAFSPQRLDSVRDKSFRDFGEDRRLTFLGEIVFVSEIANDGGHFADARAGIAIRVATPGAGSWFFNDRRQDYWLGCRRRRCRGRVRHHGDRRGPGR